VCGGPTLSQPSFLPPSDPRANYLAHQREIDEAVAGVLRGGAYILGREVASFEAEFARYLGVPHAIGVGSGTDAIHLALRACGIGPGDEVITVSHTAVGTIVGIESAGATAVLVDIDRDTRTMDPGTLGAALSPRTRAVLPVHLYGHPAALEEIGAFARERGLFLVEDCAQAAGALCRDRRIGSWGDIAAFSFYPTKNLGALGDGGAVITSRPDLAERLRMLREYGWRQRYVSEIPGVNSRLDELQAAILRVKLRHLDAENARRRSLAGFYLEELAESGLTLPWSRPEVVHVYHQFVPGHPRRDALRAALRSRGVGTLVHYPVPVHRQPAYRDRVRVAGGMERTEAAASAVLSLPLFPELRREDVERVCVSIRDWARREPAS